MLASAIKWGISGNGHYYANSVTAVTLFLLYSDMDWQAHVGNAVDLFDISVFA